MKIFPLFGRHKLETAWSYSVAGVVWRIMFSTTGRIVGEVRSQEERQASFFCLDQGSGAAAWENLRLEEPWWVGMEALHEGYLFLHKFEKPDMPEHKGIFAFDIATGRELWRNEELTFWFAFEKKVYAYRTRFDRRVGAVLDGSSGELLESHEVGIESLTAIRELARQQAASEGPTLPEVFVNGGEESRVRSLIASVKKTWPVWGNVEYLIAGEHLLVDYHVPGRSSTPENLLLENRLQVFELPEGRPVFSEILARDSKVPTPDSFLVGDGVLYFIKDRNILTAVRLTKT